MAALVPNTIIVFFYFLFYTVLTGCATSQVQMKGDSRICGIVLDAMHKIMTNMISVLNVVALNQNHPLTIVEIQIVMPTMRYSLTPSKSIVDIADLPPHTRNQLTIIFNCLLLTMPVPSLWH